MTMSNKISIILPVHNGEKFLAESIRSCLTQSYKNLELIIVNDYSADGSLLIAEQFAKQDHRIKIISNTENKNLPASLNIGHKAARGELITWTSDDNSYKPKALEIMIDELETTKVDVVFSDYNIIEEDGSFRRQFTLDGHASLLLGNIIGASFLYKKEVFERNDGYDESLHSVEDYDFWLQATRHSKFHHISQILYNFRSHKNSLSTGLSNEYSEAKKQFHTRLKTCYRKFFSSFEISNNYAPLFSNLHQHKKINVSNFLKEFSGFRKDMYIICQKSSFIDFDSLLYVLDTRIRANIQQYPTNQNFSTLFMIIKHRPQILYRYDRRNSLRIIWKSLILNKYGQT